MWSSYSTGLALELSEICFSLCYPFRFLLHCHLLLSKDVISDDLYYFAVMTYYIQMLIKHVTFSSGYVFSAVCGSTE